MFGIFKRVRELERRLEDAEGRVADLRLAVLKTKVRPGGLVWTGGIVWRSYYGVVEVLSNGVFGEKTPSPVRGCLSLGRILRVPTP